MRYEGNYYMHDRRLALLDNTLDNPVDDTAGASGSDTCPTVVKTFVNRDTCRSASTCEPAAYSSALFTLTAASLHAFFTHLGRYVYYIDGLRLEAPDDDSPCSGTPSRWSRADGGCASDTSLDSASRDALEAALRNATDANTLVRDVAASCSAGASAVGARLTVDSDCWTHVHIDSFSVFDFTYWTLEHPGTSDATKGNRQNPIRAFASSGGVALTYPSSHLMSDWRKYQTLNGRGHGYFEPIGRLGDTIDFKDLPSTLQSAGLAASLGASAGGGGGGVGGTEACGSPGEVANLPVSGNVYYVFQSYENPIYSNRKLEASDGYQRTHSSSTPPKAGAGPFA